MTTCQSHAKINHMFFRFGTFLYNCHYERVERTVFNDTLPISAHINAIKDTYINPKYRETHEASCKISFN